MSEKIESKNKALVLKAFDTFFNKRDYAAARRYLPGFAEDDGPALDLTEQAELRSITTENRTSGVLRILAGIGRLGLRLFGRDI
jgi:hypothetical protein